MREPHDRAMEPAMNTCIRLLIIVGVLATGLVFGDEVYDPSTLFKGAISNALAKAEALQQDVGVQSLRRGDFEAFTNAVRERADAEKAIVENLYYLHLASALGQKKIATYLLDLGVPADQRKGKMDLTPLDIALIAGHEDVANLLLDRGADPSLTSVSSMNALHFAVMSRSTNCLSAILERGVKVDSPLANGITALGLSLFLGDMETFRWLLEAGANPNTRDRSEQTLLHTSAALKCVEAMMELIDRGADVRATDKLGRTPLMLAAMNGAEDCATLLIEKGAPVNAIDQAGRSATAHAMRRGDLEMLDILARDGADINFKDNHGNTLAHHAVWAATNAEECIAWCFDHGVSLDTQGSIGATPVYTAVMYRQTNALKALLAHNADFQTPSTNDAWTPLLAAVWKQDVGIIRLLIAAGADLEATETDGNTPMLIAVQRGRNDVIQMLHDAGAKLNVCDKRGRSVLYFAAIRANTATFSRLLDLGVDPDIHAPPLNWSPLLDFAWFNKLEFGKLLLDAGANPDFEDETHQTAVYIATRRENADFVRMLLDAGATASVRASDGLTAWHIAKLLNREDIAEMLAAHMTPEEMMPTNRIRVYLDLDAPLAKTVCVAGSFNEWNGENLALTRREDDGWWYIEMDVYPGRYAYKFVVDGNWILDPDNPDLDFDSGRDLHNSIFTAEDRLVSLRPKRPVSTKDALVPVYFSYSDRTARYVSVAGEFNGWDEYNHQLRLTKIGLWTTDLLLRPGEYGYKFVVDGEWILDPSNTLIKVVDGVSNSLMVVERKSESTASPARE